MCFKMVLNSSPKHHLIDANRKPVCATWHKERPVARMRKWSWGLYWKNYSRHKEIQESLGYVKVLFLNVQFL